MKVEGNNLYNVDEETKALIPVVQSGASDMEKYIDGNRLFVIDPETNARIPVVEVQGGSGGGGGGDQVQVNWLENNASNVAHIRNRPYTKATFSDTLVFPTPICSGHVVEFYDGSKLISSYEWNGWLWLIKGAEPTFIFTEDTRSGQTQIDNVGFLFVFKQGVQYFITAEAGKDYQNLQVYAKSIEKISTDYTLGYLYLNVYESGNDLILPPMKVHSFGVQLSTQSGEGFFNNVEIKDSFFDSFSFYNRCKNAVFQNLKAINEEYSLNLNANGENVLIDNCDVSYIHAYCSQRVGNNQQSTIVNIKNNNLSKQDYGSINIGCDGDENYPVKAEIHIVNNTGVTDISFNSFSYGSIIDSLEVDFDESTLRSVNIGSCKFTDVALGNLVSALTSKSYSQPDRRFYYSSENVPVLTQVQKDALTASGWNMD